jgi:hypothetical protein
MMGPDDLAILIALAIGFVAFSLYAGLRRVAEAIEYSAARRSASRSPPIHVYREKV